MLSQVLIWVAIIGLGINLGLSFCFIPAVGQKGEWFIFFLVGPAMVVCGGLLGIHLATLG